MPLDTVRVTASDTSKVPNASATAASSGSDLNGKAAQAAARTLRERLVAFAAEHFDVAVDDVALRRQRACTSATRTLPFAELVRLAYVARVSLSATGFYATPKIHYDRKTLIGTPVLLLRVRRRGVRGRDRHADRREPAAARRHPARRRALAQSRDRPRPDRGRLPAGRGAGSRAKSCGGTTRASCKTHAPSTYKIPTAHDVPARSSTSTFCGASPTARTRSIGRRRSASRR